MDIEPGVHAIPDKFWTFIEKEKEITTKKHQVTKEKNENANKPLEEKKEESYFQNQTTEINKMYESNREDLKAYLRIFLGELCNDPTFRRIEFPSSLDGNIRKILHDVAEEFGLRHESEGGKKNRRMVISRNEGPKKVKQDETNQPNLANAVESSKIQEEKPKTLTAEIEEAWKKANESEMKMNDPITAYKGNKDIFYQEFKDVPDPITAVTFENLRKHSIEITFKIPDANGYPIQEFALYFYDHAHSNWIEHARSKTNKFILSDLLPSTSYTFRIGAFNELGESEFEKSFKFKTPDIFSGSALLSGANRYYDFNPGVVGDNVFTEDTEFVASFEPLKKLESRVLDVVPSFSKLALIDDGTVLQWGLTYIEEMDRGNSQQNQKEEMKDEEEEEYALRNKKPDYISAITSAPFFVFHPDIEWAKDIVVSIACGLNFCLALTISGQVYSWGLNTVGQLGHGDCVPKCDPKRIEALSKFFVKEVSALKYNAMALTDEGKVYTWGERQSELGCDPIKNRFGEIIGYKDPLSISHTPREMTKLSTYDKIVKISAGGAFNAALNQKGELFTWGDNNHGQLGHGLIDDQKFEYINVPKKVEKFAELKAIVKDVSCGDHHMLAVVEFPEEMGRSAELWSWGFSAQGQCGHGDKGARIVPTQVIYMPEEVQHIAAGFKHSLIVGKSGAVYLCGRWDNMPKSTSKGEVEFDKPVKLPEEQCALNKYGLNKTIAKVRASKCNSALILV